MLVNADEVLAQQVCEHCEAELGESEGLVRDGVLYCDGCYEELLHGEAAELLAAQIRFEMRRPRTAFMTMFD